MVNEVQSMESLIYKCPNCCADIQFDAGQQRFVCAYCSSSFSKEEMTQIAAEQEKYAEVRPEEEKQVDKDFEEQTSVYVCKTCGAAIMVDDNTAAAFCYYCHNPVILQGRVSGDLRPSYVLPFQVDRATALQHFSEWCKKHRFLPKDFSSQAQQEKMVGLYVPFWVTDVDVAAEMDALGRSIHSWTEGNYCYTETQEFAVARKAKVVLRGLPADGASHIDDNLMEAIEPFDYRAVQPFAMQYLSGFYAEKYDMDMSAVFPRIQKRAVQASDQLLRASIRNYNSISVTRADMRVMHTAWEYMLLPVWFMTYKYKDKVYEFALNGQTAKLVGTPPLSNARLAKFCCGVGLLVMLGTILLGFLGVALL